MSAGHVFEMAQGGCYSTKHLSMLFEDEKRGDSKR